MNYQNNTYTMKLKHFRQDGKAVVGSYEPSPNWSQYTHFAVMTEPGSELLASTGYFQSLQTCNAWSFKDYQNAAKCIEQAQLYANAVEMFSLISRIAICETELSLSNDAKKLLEKITDISEPVTRLMGKDAMKIINESYNRVKSE